MPRKSAAAAAKAAAPVSPAAAPVSPAAARKGKRKAKVVVVLENNIIAKKPKQDLASAAAALQKEIEEKEAELERLLEQAKIVSGGSDELEADVEPHGPVAAPAKEVPVSADNNGSFLLIETNDDSNANSKSTEEEKPIATNGCTPAADTNVVAEGSDSEDDSDVGSSKYESDENEPASTLKKAAAAPVSPAAAPVLRKGKRKAKVVVVVENNTIAKKPKQDLAAAAAALQKEIEEKEAELERLLEQAKSVSGGSDELEADVEPNEPVAAPAKEVPVSADNNRSFPVIETNDDCNADSKSTEEEKPIATNGSTPAADTNVVAEGSDSKDDSDVGSSEYKSDEHEPASTLEKAAAAPVSPAAAPVLRKGKRKAKVILVVENNTIAKKPKQDLAAAAAALQKEIEEKEAELERLLEQAKSVSGGSDELEADVEPNGPVAAPAKEVPVSADNNGSFPLIETNDDSNANSKSTEEEKPIATNGSTPAADTNVVAEGSDSEDDSDVGSSEYDSDEHEPASTMEKAGTDVKMSDVNKDAPETPTLPKAAGSKTLFAGNISFKADEVDVRDFFGNVCEIVDVRLGTDRDGLFKGYCHVDFASEAEALRALEFNGKELLGRPVRLDIATGRGESTNVRSSQEAQPIFVKGFDASLGEDELKGILKEHFGKCGKIQRISIPMGTGVPKGIAFIDFKDTEMTQKALALHNSEVGGFQLTVNAAKPRAEGGGRGRGRSGDKFGSGGRNRGGRGRGRRGGRGRGV